VKTPGFGVGDALENEKAVVLIALDETPVGPNQSGLGVAVKTVLHSIILHKII
jgi:hypothetical protein